MNDCDLNFDGVHELPLEQLYSLSVPDTKVTSAGLKELHRCKELRCLALDGRQFDDEVAAVVRALPKLVRFCARGADVTDEHLERLRQLGVEELYLEQTSASREGVASLKQAMPRCKVFVQ